MKIILFILSIFTTILSFGQEQCLSYQIIEKQIEQSTSPNLVINEISILKNNSFYPTKAGIVIKIPIVFHIIHNGDNLGNNENLSDSIILEQIKRINQDFRAFNTDTANIPNEFKAFLADTDIEFCLAKKDTTNQFTSGIIRHQYSGSTHLDNYVNNTIKPATIWNRNNYLNIWTVNLTNSSVNGYATPPLSSTNILKDGIVLNYLKVGNDRNNDIGRTLVHEIGHWLGLFHIWGDDNGACTGDDGINDTPNQADAYQNCPSGIPNSCGSNDMYINYMDYTDADCAFMFTNDQKTRMHSVLNGFRSSILTSPACLVSDVIIDKIIFPNGTICQEYFTPAVKIKNIGFDTIYDYSIDFYINNTFQTTISGTQKIAPNQIFYVKSTQTFSSSSSNIAKFIISTSTVEFDSNNEKTSVFSNINTGFGFETFPYLFEENSFPPANLYIHNTNNDSTWQHFLGNNNKCTVFYNDSTTKGKTDALETTDFNLFDIVDAGNVLTFDYLYKTKPGFSDTLTVYFSLDCGVHWYPLWSKNGLALSHNITDSNPFIYTDEVFKKDSIDMTEISYNNDIKKVRFLFENKSGGGNNLYIDNIQFYLKSVGITDLEESDIQIYPNPSNHILNIIQEEKEILQIDIFNVKGQLIYQEKTSNQSTTVSLLSFSKGIFFIKLTNNKGSFLKKIIKR